MNPCASQMIWIAGPHGRSRVAFHPGGRPAGVVYLEEPHGWVVETPGLEAGFFDTAEEAMGRLEKSV